LKIAIQSDFLSGDIRASLTSVDLDAENAATAERERASKSGDGGAISNSGSESSTDTSKSDTSKSDTSKSDGGSSSDSTKPAARAIPTSRDELLEPMLNGMGYNNLIELAPPDAEEIDFKKLLVSEKDKDDVSTNPSSSAKKVIQRYRVRFYYIAGELKSDTASVMSNLSKTAQVILCPKFSVDLRLRFRFPYGKGKEKTGETVAGAGKVITPTADGTSASGSADNSKNGGWLKWGVSKIFGEGSNSNSPSSSSLFGGDTAALAPYGASQNPGQIGNQVKKEHSNDHLSSHYKEAESAGKQMSDPIGLQFGQELDESQKEKDPEGYSDALWLCSSGTPTFPKQLFPHWQEDMLIDSIFTIPPTGIIMTHLYLPEEYLLRVIAIGPHGPLKARIIDVEMDDYEEDISSKVMEEKKKESSNPNTIIGDKIRKF
jgi:hypothetical protein